MLKVIFYLLVSIVGILPLGLVIVSGVYRDKKKKEITKKLSDPSFLDKDNEGSYFTNAKHDVLMYIKDRVDPTIACYSSKATASATFYTCFMILQITYSALVPVFLLIPEGYVPAKIIGALLGAFVSVASGVSATCKFKEKWLQYLGLRDKLFAERSMYIAGNIYEGRGPWGASKDGPINFVEKCEDIIALEYRNLADNLSKVDESKLKQANQQGGNNNQQNNSGNE